VQFEDFANLNARRLLDKYRNDYCMFNDDIQGTGAVTLAGILSAMRLLNQSLQDQQILFYGAGSAAFGIAEIIIQKMVQDGMDIGNARRKICFFDSRGLVVKGRSNLTNQKMLYAHELAEESNLESAIDSLQPNILIGVSGQGGAFSESIVRKMGEINNRPIIFALSNPTSKSECTAEQAYTWTEGKAIFVSGSPFNPVTYEENTFSPGQGNNAYIFPGVGLGVVVSKSSQVTDDMFIAAADTLADLVSEEDLAKGRLYPSLVKIREISCKIAVNVAKQAFENHTAQVPQPENLEKCVVDSMFKPKYKSYL
jgi:malate dehydrogenase (oxaloacetate-decarboxylating)(NADP+)